MNQPLLNTLHPDDVDVMIRRADEAAVDEMWSYVGHKNAPRWLWHAIDHHTGKVLAYGFGRRQDQRFLKLKARLEPCGITRYDTDHWGAYTRHLDTDEHNPGKRNTQRIERKHLTLRTRIKRLTRRTICFSRSGQMHDIVIGLFVGSVSKVDMATRMPLIYKIVFPSISTFETPPIYPLRTALRPFGHVTGVSL